MIQSGPGAAQRLDPAQQLQLLDQRPPTTGTGTGTGPRTGQQPRDPLRQLTQRALVRTIDLVTRMAERAAQLS